MNEQQIPSTPDELNDQLILARCTIERLETLLAVQSNAQTLDVDQLLIMLIQINDLSTSVQDLVRSCIDGGTVTKSNIEFIGEMMRIISHHAMEIKKCLVKHE